MSTTVPALMDLCVKTTEAITKISSDKIPPEKTREIRDRIQKTYDSLEKNKDRLWLHRTHRGRMLVNLIHEALTKMLDTANEFEKGGKTEVIRQLTEDLYGGLSELENHVSTIVWEEEKREIQYT